MQLALPSLATLLVEPLLVLIDSAMVGHLGTDPLAGLAVASTIVTTIVGICIFLSYATTAATARLVGAHKPAEALRHGIEGIWLAFILGTILALALGFGAIPVVELFNPAVSVLPHAVAYIHASAIGLPAMLVVLAATGTLRGFADTRTPLWAATSGALANIPLNFVLIYVANLGIFGAGLGTAIAQFAIASFLLYRLSLTARELGLPFTPSRTGVLSSLRGGIPLIIRTLCLRAAIVLQIASATALGTTALASNQIVMTMWNFAAFGLDALATAAQILVGQSLGTRDVSRVREVLSVCMRWGLGIGMATGLLFFAASWIVPVLITPDSGVSTLATHVMWIVALALPVASLAYMLDGVLIGAGDTRALAVYMMLSLVVFAPLAVVIMTRASSFESAGLYWLWGAYAFVFMAMRAGTMIRRVRGTDWMGI